MNFKATLWVLVLAIPAFAACSQTESPGQVDESAPTETASAVKPIEGKSLTEALALAEAASKNLLVEYWDESCPWCEKMDDQTLGDPAVQKALGKVLYVRLEKGGTGEAFAARWGESGTPSYVVMKPDGSVPGNVLTGLVAKQDFLTYLAWAETTTGPEPSPTTGGS